MKHIKHADRFAALQSLQCLQTWLVLEVFQVPLEAATWQLKDINCCHFVCGQMCCTQKNSGGAVQIFLGPPGQVMFNKSFAPYD